MWVHRVAALEPTTDRARRLRFDRVAETRLRR
jgi:hypothetical protein